jgi:hypothetical protein
MSNSHDEPPWSASMLLANLPTASRMRLISEGFGHTGQDNERRLMSIGWASEAGRAVPEDGWTSDRANFDFEGLLGNGAALTESLVRAARPRGLRR